jgi:predicted amidophosphoribosyltransferase
MTKCVLCHRTAEPFQTVCRVCRNNFYDNLNTRNAYNLHQLGFPLLSVSKYRGANKNWLLKLKTQAPIQQNLYLNSIIDSLVAHWVCEIKALNADIIVSIPSNPWRVVFERSLSSFLAELVSKETGIPHEKNILSAPWTHVIQKWGQQKLHNRSQRFENSHRFFQSFNLCLSSRTLHKRILLVDDICTTGATLKSCASKLNQGGLKVVGAFVLAHVEIH